MERDYDFLFKLLLVGGGEVGKTSVLQRFAHGSFNENYTSTIGIEFAVKRVNVDGKDVKLQIWDTAGPERFRAITNSYYRGCRGVMIVYDVTKQQSFEGVQTFLRDVRSYCDDNIVILLVGNKADLESERAVEYGTAQEYAEEQGVDFIETSASNNTNVEEAFMRITKSVVRTHLNDEPLPQIAAVGLAHNPKRSKTKVPKDGNKSKICTLL